MVSYLHEEKGIVHRDLKLSNVMIHFVGKNADLMEISKEKKKKFLEEVDLTSTPFEVKITDYGLSKGLNDIE